MIVLWVILGLAAAPFLFLIYLIYIKWVLSLPVRLASEAMKAQQPFSETKPKPPIGFAAAAFGNQTPVPVSKK